LKIFDTIFIDFDGTIVNSLPAVGTAIIRSLENFGITGLTLDDMHAAIGPPLSRSMCEIFGLPRENLRAAVDMYREYHAGMLGLYTIYDGVEDMLKALKARGKCLVVATSKWEKNAVDILENFGLVGLFDLVAGDDNISRHGKEAVIEYALEKLSANREMTLMVGDRNYDILGAKEFGLESMGVLWGFGDRAELESAGAEYIAATPEDVVKMLG